MTNTFSGPGTNGKGEMPNTVQNPSTRSSLVPNMGQIGADQPATSYMSTKRVAAITTEGESAAFFDLDRTVITGSSLAHLGYAAWRSGLIELGDVWRQLLNGFLFRWRGEVSTDPNLTLHRALSLISGRQKSDLDQLIDPLVQKLLGQVHTEAAQFLKIHQRAGRDCYLVSASAIEIVRPLAVELGCVDAMATEAEVVDGAYTGRLAKPFLHGTEKARAVATLADERNYDLARSFAYGDSIGDLPMLNLVGAPVAVNPDSALASQAKERGWPVVHCAKTSDSTRRRLGAFALLALVVATAVAVGRSDRGESNG